MKVVYIHQYFRTPRMAGGTRSYEFARRLVAHGHEVTVVTAESEIDAHRERGWRQSSEEGIQILWAAVPYDNSMAPWRRILAFVQFLAAACRKAPRLPQDVVFATSTPLTVAIPGAWSAFLNRAPMVLEIRDLWPAVPIAMGVLRGWPTRKLATMLERFAYRRATSVVALSPDMADGVLSVRPDVPVYVIPNACDQELFGKPSEADEALLASSPWIKNRPVVLYAGTFGKANGVGYLVDVADSLRSLLPEAAVVLVGGGAEFEVTRSRAARVGVLDENCFVLGQIPKEQVAAWFRAASISTSLFVNIPELAANSANKFFDALAAGRPIAVNHGGWLAEQVSESGAGLILPPHDTRRAAQMLADFLADPQGVRRASKAAKELGRHSFDRDLLAGELEHVLFSAMDQSRAMPVASRRAWGGSGVPAGNQEGM